MPRGNPNIWQHYGQSFAQLSATEARVQSSQNTSSSSGPSHSAGAPSNLPPRGAGTFAKESSWSLGTSSNPTPKATENRSQYHGPPEEYRRRDMMRTDKSNFPKPTYPNDYKTLNQQDYSRDRLAGAERMHLIKPSSNGNLIPRDVQPQFSTTYHKQFPPQTREDIRSWTARTQAGNIATQHPGFNVITGGDALGNHRFEAHQQGKDYRRVR